MAQPLAAASGPHVWQAAELAADPGRWSYTLDAAELDALSAAADAVAGSDLAGVTRDTSAHELKALLEAASGIEQGSVRLIHQGAPFGCSVRQRLRN